MVETPETPVLTKTYFVRQHINMGIHNIMYQVSKQLVDIVNSMLCGLIMVTIKSPIFLYVARKSITCKRCYSKPDNYHMSITSIDFIDSNTIDACYTLFPT